MGEQEMPYGISYALSYAVSEWLLMLLLFIDGLFSYMVTKFAKYCKLQTPCLFCSRLDHILGSKDAGFYRNLICSSHKLEISSWAYCHIHQKLADIPDMCESCLLSSVTKKKSDSETYRSLVGKLQINYHSDDIINPNVSESGKEIPLQGDSAPAFVKESWCSCCKNIFIRSSANKLLQTRSFGAEVVEASGGGSGLTGFDHHPETPYQSKTMQLSLNSSRVSHAESKKSDDWLPHRDYSKLKIISESEALASDDANCQIIVNGNKDANKVFASQSTQTDLDASDTGTFQKSPSNNDDFEKLIHSLPIVAVNTIAVTEKKNFMVEPSNVVSLGSNSSAGNELKQLDKNEVQEELKQVDRNVVQEGHSSAHFNVRLNEALTDDATSKDVETIDVISTSSNINDEELKTTDLTDNISKPRLIVNDVPVAMSGTLDLNDTYKLVTGNKGNEASPSSRDPSRAQDELRLMLSQLSFARGLDLPWNEMTPSPRIHGTSEEIKSFERSGSSGFPSRRFSLERNESGLSSVDGSVFSEIEGESAVDRLKRLVVFEKKTLALLYKELDEERSASAIAANQAMAMITRLQEEKAAMQMEALHYQRMMEEQAEYDHEVLQKSADLLAEKEKEVDCLKTEISTYRRQFIDVSKGNDTLSPMDDVDEKKGFPPDSREHGILTDGYHRSSHSGMGAINFGKEGEKLKKDILSDFDEEKMYISKCLKKLEKRLHLFSKHGMHTERHLNNSGEYDISEYKNGQNDEKAIDDFEIPTHCSNMIPVNSQTGKDSGYLQTGSCSPRQNTDSSLPIHLENHKDYSSHLLNSNSEELDQHFQTIDGGNNILAFEAEIFHLADRLKALEADQSFIAQTIDSLTNGDHGLLLVQEIASHLHELRIQESKRKTIHLMEPLVQ